MDDLKEIEAIKQLKYRYLRSVDLKLWDELRETFTEDAVSAYADGAQAFRGREAVMSFLVEALEGDLITLHQVHHPEIALTSSNAATGTWYLQDYVINPGSDRPVIPGRTILTGAAFYSDEYLKVDDQWKIKKTGYTRTFETFQSLDDHPSMEIRSPWTEER
jgi:hypothetical protein